MSDHEHHHEHGEECHCHDHDHEHHEQTSIEQAGGCAVGLRGDIVCFNADAEARFAKALIQVGKWVTEESGVLLGHIKAAIVDDNGNGITLNLTDLENGVEHHGTLEPCEKVHFDFMCAVLDVDEHELKHEMYHAVDDTGLDYTLDEEVECHCHDHEHGHHHHHHDGEECHCHDHHHDHHHHDGECHCHDHDHEHKHHDEECHCPECEAKKASEAPKKKSFLDRLRRK